MLDADLAMHYIYEHTERVTRLTHLNVILNTADIKAIYVNGKTALKYYEKYTEPVIKRPAICLPSTSPANAAWGMEKLLNVWKCISNLRY